VQSDEAYFILWFALFPFSFFVEELYMPIDGHKIMQLKPEILTEKYQINK